MIWFLIAPLAGKAINHIALFLGGALMLALLMGAPILGILTNPLAPFWLSGQHTVGVNGAPAAPAAAVPTTEPAVGGIIATPVPIIGASSLVDRAIAEAMTWRGTRYLWGGCDKRGVDCSCFVRNAWAAAGIHLPRTTTEQVRAVAFVPRDQIQPGDLVFFNNTCTECGLNPTHVGMALGGGQMINAGDPVQIASITTGFYASHYASAGRAY